MVNKLFFFFCSAIVLFSGCKNRPSSADIEKKVLMEYSCAETAKVNALQIIKSTPTTSLLGFKGYEYQVSGEVEWPAGCNEFGTAVPAGFKEKFENKTVVLIKGDEGWQ